MQITHQQYEAEGQIGICKTNTEMSLKSSGTKINLVLRLALMKRPKHGERKKESAHDSDHTSLSIKHSGGSVMTQPCMAASGMGLLIFINDVTHSGSSRTNSEVLQKPSVCPLKEKCI